ncbi:MAG: DUF134 domain-containing protein [Desulfovibrionaceae bacterium]|nr:DUF134 domain-containing protein [Desulfovibrionaceae bacterium]
MPRPTLCRFVETTPNATYFKPRGIPASSLTELRLALEELEALRLADMEGLTAIEAASHMRVSRHTFGRILQKARQKAATALCTGQALRIEGGHYSLAEDVTARPGFSGRIAVSCTGPTPDSVVAERFGRAGGFLLVDLPEMSASYMDNAGSQASGMEAGIATVRALAEAKVSVVLGSVIGPKVFAALREAGISVCLDVSGSVRQVVDRFCKGELPFADAPNRD